MPDDLSCGPIASGETAERVAWWAEYYDPQETHERLAAFWAGLAATSDRLILWFSRHAAAELAFFYACVERLGDRPYGVLEVTGLNGPNRVSILQPESLRALFGKEKTLSSQERREAIDHWRRLRSENTPFRVVTPAGLVSAPLEYFDSWLLANSGESPRPLMSLVGEAMVEFSGQVGNVMLQERVFALVADGVLVAEGDLTDPRSARVYLPPEH